MNDFDSLYELIAYFQTEKIALDYLTLKRWNGAIVCPHCNHNKVYSFSDGIRFKCASCRNQFTAKVGTIFEGSKIPLKKWFIAIYLLTSHKKGISSHQLGRDLKITQKTAWFMLMRIRVTLFDENPLPLNNIVEVDETFIGGANKNKSKSKRKELHRNGAQTGGNHKKAVLGMLERGRSVKALVISKADGKTIKPFLFENIDKKAIVVTDGFGGYKNIDRVFEEHHIIYHDKDEYVRGAYHTNTLEGFWSLFKRAIIGIYHSTSGKHLQQYVNESAFRYNTRKKGEGERINIMLSNMEGRLKYKDLVEKDGEKSRLYFRGW